MYMLDGAPFKKDATGKVFDRSGQRVRLIGESLKILQQLATDPKFENTQVVSCVSLTSLLSSVNS
jgi:magnesium-dependent phosphatase 1